MEMSIFKLAEFGGGADPDDIKGRRECVCCLRVIKIYFKLSGNSAVAIMYQIGDRICIIDRNNKVGVINSISEYRGQNHYVIMLDSGHTTTCAETSIRLEVLDPDPFQLLEQATFQTKTVFSVTSIINKMFGNSNDVI